jgi:hypothetical protein
MNTPVNPEPRRPLRTADLATAAAQRPDNEVDEIREEAESERQPQALTGERLEPLFPTDAAAQYRTRWADVQSGFVDDPRRAVAKGDELVAEVMQSLAESFAHERERLDAELSHTGEASTETLRVGLRRYRSFFDRLLAL